MARPKKKVVVPTINDEPQDEYVEGVKIVKLDYMGPDADSDSDYVRRLTSSAGDFDRFSIRVDEL
jgi:hypothetical protein